MLDVVQPVSDDLADFERSRADAFAAPSLDGARGDAPSISKFFGGKVGLAHCNNSSHAMAPMCIRGEASYKAG
ncbi:hypothetical protein LA76x_4930 [Lysobacter antibioticus]|uniref:Uncharacterized protein n=1 Tax=Lysobacter antibioticus TaxID=84531 RepID=A0A0S2FHL6_LYSAN|nr:hypothetical protein LA76x_4930 [Lysobacter antibioticus]